MKSNMKEPWSNGHERDEENRVVINMNVQNDDDFLSPYSPSAEPLISEGVAEFINSAVESVRPKESLTLRISGSCISSSNHEKYERAIKQYYKEKYIVNTREIRFSNIIAIILGILGVLVLTLAVFLNFQIQSAIWTEVIDIVAWVLLWEAVDVALFKARALRVKKQRYFSLISMKIEYKN